MTKALTSIRIVNEAKDTNGWLYSTDGENLKVANGPFGKISYILLHLVDWTMSGKLKNALLNTFEISDKILLTEILDNPEPTTDNSLKSRVDRIKYIKDERATENIDTNEIEAFAQSNSRQVRDRLVNLSSS